MSKKKSELAEAIDLPVNIRLKQEQEIVPVDMSTSPHVDLSTSGQVDKYVDMSTSPQVDMSTKLQVLEKAKQLVANGEERMVTYSARQKLSLMKLIEVAKANYYVITGHRLKSEDIMTDALTFYLNTLNERIQKEFNRSLF